MPDFDAAFDALEHLDDAARLAVELSSAMWQQMYEAADARAERAEFLAERLHTWATQWGLSFDLSAASAHWDEHHPRPEAPLMSRYHTLLLERSSEVRELRRQLDDALDSREQAEIRAEQAEALLEKARWHSLSGCEPRSPLPWDDERIDQLDAEVQLLRRQLKTARETEFVAIDKMQQERARAKAAEQKCDVLRSEIRALCYRKGRP